MAYAPPLVAALALLAGLRAWFMRTLGRRRNRYERLGRLGTNAHLSFFASVLGEPPAIRRSLVSKVEVWHEGSDEAVLEDRLFFESVWIDRDYYVHAFSDRDDAVAAFSVTTRNPKFRPTLRSPGYTLEERSWLLSTLGFRERRRPLFEVTLGKTRFAALDEPGIGTKSSAWVGAHNLHYFEAHYYGNPGNYQWYVFSINDAGAMAWAAPMVGTLMPTEAPWDFDWGFGDDPPYEEMSGWQEFRHRARVNTYTVISPTLRVEDYPPRTDLRTYPAAFGPNSAHVRTLP